MTLLRFTKHSSLIVVGTIAYLIFMHLGSVNGQLLSDSVSLIYTCFGWQENNQMGHQLLSLFYRSSNEAGGSFMYRPLAILSFCTDYMLWGEQAFAHKLIQLLWHIGNGILLYVLLSKVCRFYRIDTRFAAVTASLFLVSHLSPEVSVWVAGRFDALVQTFMFLSLYAFWSHRRFMSLLILILALLSKESAVVIVPILISLSCFRHWGQTRFIQKTGQETWLFIALLIAYFMLRWLLFGQTTQVYPQAGGLLERLSSHIITFPGFLWRTWFGAVNYSILNWAYLMLLMFLSGYSFYQARQHQRLRLWLFIASAIVIILLALVTQVGPGEKSGTGARLFYILIPWQTALVSLPMLFNRGRLYRIMMLIFLLLTGLMHCLVIQQWTAASQISKNIINAVPDMATSVDQDDWSLLLVPENIGPALLARNAQGGMVSPPFQDKAYLSSVVPFIWRDLELWRQRANSSFVKQFKINSKQPNEQPLYALCLTKQGSYAKQEISHEMFKSKQVWQTFWENLINEHVCYQ